MFEFQIACVAKEFLFRVCNSVNDVRELPTAGSYDHACSFGAVAMYLTWPAMNRVLAESVRMVKDGRAPSG